MPSAKRRLGAFGEAVAQAHLRAAGYAILAINWRCSGGEIDLIAQCGDQVVFVEVRTRKRLPTDGIPPEATIGFRKAQRLIALAYAYLEAGAYAETTSWRIDLVAVELDLDGRVLRVAHIPYAVEG